MYPPVPPDDDGSTNVKVWQLQIRAPTTAANQRWLTSFDLATSAPGVATATAVDMTSANAVGALLVAVSGNEAVLFNNGAPNTTIAGIVTYSVPTANTTHSFNVSAAGTVTVGDRIFGDGFGG